MQNDILSMTIKQICKTKGISLNTLIHSCDLSKSFFYDLEKRNTAPSCEKILRIAKYLDVSVDYLLDTTIDTKDIKTARAITKSWLESTDITIPEIEKAIGTNYATIKLWSCGIGDFFNNRLTILADLIGCSVDYLLGRTDVVEVNMGYSYPPEEIAAHGADGTRGTFTLPPKETT